jgi:hypothetical protein
VAAESTVCRRTNFAGHLIGAQCDDCRHTNVAHGPEGCAVCLMLAPDLARVRELLRAHDDAMQAEGVPDEQRRRVTTRLLYGSSCLCTIDTRDGSIAFMDYDCPTHGTPCTKCGRRIPKPNTLCASCVPGGILNESR